MYYLQSRYYDPKVGRFINADSAEYVSIQGGNLFAYCGNCPTKNADYFGFCYTPTYSEEIVEKLKNNTDNTTHQPSYTYDEAIGVGNNSITLEEFSKELKKIFKKVGIVVSDFIVNTLWKEWIVNKAWNWFNGPKWYQSLVRNLTIGVLGGIVGALIVWIIPFLSTFAAATLGLTVLGGIITGVIGGIVSWLCDLIA